MYVVSLRAHLSLALTLALTSTLALTLALALSLALSLSISLALTLALSLSRSLPFSLSRSLAFSLSHFLAFSLSHSLDLPLSRSLAVSRERVTYIHTYICRTKNTRSETLGQGILRNPQILHWNRSLSTAVRVSILVGVKRVRKQRRVRNDTCLRVVPAQSLG